MLLLLLTAAPNSAQNVVGGGGASGGAGLDDAGNGFNDNRKPAAAMVAAAVTSDVSAPATAARAPRFVQPNGLFGFFGTLRSIKQLYDEVSGVTFRIDSSDDEGILCRVLIEYCRTV